MYNTVFRVGYQNITEHFSTGCIFIKCSERQRDKTMTTTTTTTIARGKYHIWTVGCQMNQADSQRIQAMLDEMGWEESGMDQANLVVLNTCSVRHAPEEKAHNQLALLK